MLGTWDKIVENMRKEELIKQLQNREPLLANAVSHMVEYIQDRYPAAYPSKAQTERIASQNITIAAIRVLDSRQLDRLQDVLDHIAYDREYYMPERGHEMHR